MKTCRPLVALAVFAAMTACGSQPVETQENHVTAEALEAHVAVLASDDMDGRAPGTAGYDAAAVYVAEQFQLAGLEPAGIADSYFQPIVFKHIKIMEETANLILRSEAQPLQLQYLDSYYFLLNPQVPVLDVTAPLVFAGYGITAPEQGISSYKGLDVAGKIAVVLMNAPKGLGPEINAVLSSAERKAADAANAGAAGMILVFSKPDDKNYPFVRRASHAKDGAPYWLMPDGRPHSDYAPLSFVARLAPEKGALVFGGAQQSYEDILELVAKGGPIPSFDLKTSVTARYGVSERVTVSSNVLARLPAQPAEEGSPAGESDEGLQEAVMLIGHLDHLGRGEPVEGDDIYNGAVDNALGIAAIIEAAKALAATEEPRQRDIYFAALTAEESGLQGSQYLARYLPMPQDALTSVLNIDMPVALYPFASIHASGETHSTLGKFALSAAQKYGLTREDDPMPDEAIFVRSDHYSFVERGIPSIYLQIGVATPDGSATGGLQAFEDFLNAHYHMPSDEIELPIDWQAAALFADVHVEMLRELATTREAIAWTKDSFFNQPRRQP
ncbi:MAG: M20/M25/M40 family metallo-hydrolase [Pseudomonadota bacterium]